MDPSLSEVIKQMEGLMSKSIDHLKAELHSIRAGKASPAMIDSVTVDYYGTPTPVNQVGNVSVLDSHTLSVVPWERKMIPAIERAIRDANLGFNPMSDGEMVRIPIPRLTEDRRKDLVKQSKAEGEKARVAIRKHRHDALGTLKQLQKDGTAEDAIKTTESKVEEVNKEFMRKVDEVLKVKEEEIMTV